MESKIVSGSVLDVQRVSFSHVWGSGGHAHSTNSVKTDLFLRGTDGHERHVEAFDDVAARVGNDVSAVYVHYKGIWELALIRNHSIDRSWHFAAGWARGVQTFVAWTVLLAAIVLGICGAAMLLGALGKSGAADRTLGVVGAIGLAGGAILAFAASKLRKGKSSKAQRIAVSALAQLGDRPARTPSKGSSGDTPACLTNARTE